MHLRRTLLWTTSTFLLISACGEQSGTTNTSATDMPASEPTATVAAPADAPTLADQLAERQANFEKNAPDERIAATTSALAEIANSGIVEDAINKGDKAPDFTLQNAVGESVNLYSELEKGPVILTWYRGSWCPYCNLQLHDYQKHLAAIQAAGAQFVAISPELPDGALSMKEKNELEFIVLSDVGNNVARDYGIVYRIPDSISAGYQQGGRNDLSKINGDDSLELPLAVTYVVGRDGTVEYAFVDADYRKRAETSEVVAFVSSL